MSDESTFEPDLADIEALLRELDADDLVLEAPPADIWDGIAARLQLADDDAPSRPADDRAAGGTVTVAPFGRSRTWAMPLLAAAAAVVLIVGGIAITRSGRPADTIAEVDLAFQPGFDEAGATSAAHAALLDDDGKESIAIVDATLPFELDEDAVLELWLIKPDAEGGVADLVSLGDIDPDGPLTFAVPAGYDPDLYSVVDISIEPHDGDASHSGRSILRGALQTA